MGILTTLSRLILAAVLGGAIGWERSFQRKPAGFRTHILVSLGSALFMLISMYMKDLGGPADPGRIAAQVVTGIGFIGAGTIWVSGGSVHGLTTAASLWTCAGVGLAVGCGYYSAAIIAAAVVLISLVVLSKLEARLKIHDHEDEL